MKRVSKALPVLLACLLLAAGCAKATPQPTPDPDTASLTGLWEQLIPIQSMPQQISLDASGSAAVDDQDARWRLESGTLDLRRGGSETRYSYTVSGYMMTLYDPSSDTSEFYINPDQFAAGAADNVKLAGQWAAWSTFSMMNFDGDRLMDNIVYTTAGRTALQSGYAARDGILQTGDASGNYTYNLYSFGSDGSLELAETTDYDKPDKQWTSYWKLAQPDAALLADWTLAFDTSPGDTGLPSSLSLRSGGEADAAPRGKPSVRIQWEDYNGGFLILKYGDTDLQYAWCAPQGSTLSLGNPDVDEAWYIDASRFHPTAQPLSSLNGTWGQEGSSVALKFDAKASALAVTNGEGKTASFSVSAADGLLKLASGSSTYYMAYDLDGDTLHITYGDFPYLDQAEMPVTLSKS